MINNKKRTIIELILFYLLAITPLIIGSAYLASKYGYDFIVSQKASKETYLLGVFGMFAPTIAALIMRYATGEKFKNSYLELTIKHKWQCFMLAIIMPVLQSVLGAFLIWLLILHKPEIDSSQSEYLVSVIWVTAASCCFLFFHAFGEEWGWRGYMMPKLMTIMNKPAAVIVGGVLWGLWHAPLTICGHNFGVGYKLYPYSGIACMCLLCVLENGLLTALTERSKSIYPASICHAIHNSLSEYAILSIMLVNPEILQNVRTFTPFIAYIPILIVYFGIGIYLLCKSN